MLSSHTLRVWYCLMVGLVIAFGDAPLFHKAFTSINIIVTQFNRVIDSTCGADADFARSKQKHQNPFLTHFVCGTAPNSTFSSTFGARV